MSNPTDSELPSRRSEWFVPKFGPLRFRTFIGLLFLPYTGMVLSFSVIGSLLARHIFYDRLAAIVIIYFLGLGIAAHALDALGSKGIKPWGTVFTKTQLWVLALVSLLLAYCIAGYYIFQYAPLLLAVAIIEGFFVFAYNLEWFDGRFHTDQWFAFSWGGLPVLAGYILQTNSISFPAICLAVSMALFSAIEIKASRPYKELKRKWPDLNGEEQTLLNRYETLLKCVSLGVMLLGGGLLLWRVTG